MNEQHTPFTTLGKHLKYVREQLNRTIAEVSGAVEIDDKTLERIESGAERPPEDILMLLISHLEVQDQEAVQLWELAGYDGEVPDQFRPNLDIQPGGKATVMLLALDMRTMYSDGFEVATTPAGLTLNFTQAAADNATTPVAKVGMSFDQAERVLKDLENALLRAKYQRGPKGLSAGTN
jgi:transcriptional regulator with XRE-family HTH domain